MKAPILLLAISSVCLTAQLKSPNLEFDMMTWAEVKSAIHDKGFVNVIVYNGGTEQRGPQNVNGGHTLMARETAHEIALKVGHTLVAPILAYSPNTASADLPGTIGLTNELFAAMNEQIAEQLITSGFKNVFLMGDHGGGQKELGEVAKKLDAKYGPQGIHVYWCDEMYDKAQNDYWKWLADNNYPSYGHASIMDTSEMLYLSTLGGQDRGWVRTDLIKTAVGDPVPARGSRPAGAVAGGGRGRGRGQRDPNAPPRINNGITGDARPSTPELGKRIFDMKVDYAVRQMNQFLAIPK